MKSLISLCVLTLALSAAGVRAADEKAATNAPAAKTEAKDDKGSSSTNMVAVIKTSEGTMVIEFWPDVAPKTVENFETLAKKGFYDGTCFHRVINGFMIQGGDPLTKDPSQEDRWGTGGPDQTVPPEFSDRHHDRGVISMAHARSPVAGSQFFICQTEQHRLDHQYTCFGKLIKGEDVLDKIATAPTHSPDRPNKRIDIESIKIVPADSVK